MGPSSSLGWDGFDISPSISPPSSESVISVISSFENLGDPEDLEDPLNKLLVLDSLFPVVEHLPGVTQHQTSGVYYVQGRIDQESLYCYTKRIGELTLGADPDPDSRLVMHIFVRIARLQDPESTLFPSLHHLRIACTSKYLDFLDIFLPSSLTTIELTAISDDDPYYPSVLSFLESAIDQAPLISTLILGPGRIQDEILRITPKYQHLRRLEMRNVGISMTNQLLRDIGLLRNLETFVLLDNGTSTYDSLENPAIPIGRQDRQTEAFNTPYSTPRSSRLSPGPRRQQDLEPEEAMYVPFLPSRSPCQGLSPESTSVMDQVCPQISLSVRSLSPEPTVSQWHDVPLVGAPVIDFSLFPALRTLKVDGSFGLIEGLVTKVNPSNLHVLSIDFTQLGLAKKSARGTVKLLRRLIPTWGNTLVAVILKSDYIADFSLPSGIFENLLLRPEMKILEITGIGIASTDIKLHRLEELVCSQLEILHLPVHFTAGSIAFVELRYIAEHCPHLKSLRCRLRSFWDIPVPVPKSHGLEVLSVSNAAVQLEQQLLFKIARYLDSAFPDLKTIKTHYKNESKAQQWGLISDLVKVCQAVRRDECARHGI